MIFPLELWELAVKLTVALIVDLIVVLPQLLGHQHPHLFQFPDTGFRSQLLKLFFTSLAQLVSDRRHLL